MSDKNGFLLIDKQMGITSHDLVNIVRKKIGTKKVGHAGTLDPMATGLMLMGVGNGTRLLEYLVGSAKTYKVKMELGKRSDTFDLEGKIEKDWVDKRDESTISEDEILKVIKKYIGNISQVPPIFSALKINGVKAYELARSGKNVDMKPRQINIEFINNIVIASSCIEFDVRCSSGTYIRSLVHDIGAELKCGAIMTGLIRTSIADFNLSQSVKSDDLNEHTELLPLSLALSSFVKYDCNKNEKEDIFHGKFIDYSGSDIEINDNEMISLFFEGDLIAVAEKKTGLKKICPKKVFCLTIAGCVVI